MLVSGHLLLSAGSDDMGSTQQRIRLLFCDLIRERVISGSPEEIHLSCCLNYQGTKACFSHLMKILQLFHILPKRSKGGCTAVVYNTEWSHLKIPRSQLQVGSFKSTQFVLKIHYFSDFEALRTSFQFANTAQFTSLAILATKPLDHPAAEWPEISKQLWSASKGLLLSAHFQKASVFQKE